MGNEKILVIDDSPEILTSFPIICARKGMKSIPPKTGPKESP